MEATVHMLGTYHPKQIIKLAADIGFLRTVTLENCNDNSDQFNICVRDIYIDDLGERVFNEIFGERMLDVVVNPCTKNEKVAAFFIQNLKDCTDKLNKLLEKNSSEEF